VQVLVEGPLNNLKQSMVAFARPQRSWQSLATPVFTPAQMATAATGGSQVKKGRGRVRIQVHCINERCHPPTTMRRAVQVRVCRFSLPAT
jgi:hypothetical protein